MKIGEAHLLGLSQDFHPLDNAPAERTMIKHLRRNAKVLYYYYCFYITKFKYNLFIHNLPVPIPCVVSVYGGMRLCSVILVFDDYNKLFQYTQPCAVPYNRISMPVSFQSPP